MTRNPKCNRLASSSKDGTIRIWDTVTRHTSITMSQHISAVTCIRWGGDGLLYSSSRDKTIKIWDTTQVPTIYYLEIINITDIFFLFILTNSLLFIKGKAYKNVGRSRSLGKYYSIKYRFCVKNRFFWLHRKNSKRWKSRHVYKYPSIYLSIHLFVYMFVDDSNIFIFLNIVLINY